MNKEEIEKYRIRDYYMLPVEVVDNIFYSFEQQNKQLKEKIDKYKNISEKFEHWLRLELEIKCKNEYVVPFKIALEKLLELENGDNNE